MSDGCATCGPGHDTVEVPWDRLLDLIIQYGSERFATGYRHGKATAAVKVSSAVPDPASDDWATLRQLVSELETLRRAAGDD